MPRRAVVPLFGRPAADPNAFEVLRKCVFTLASLRRTPQLFKVRVDGLELQGLADGLAREFTQTGEVDLTHTNVHAVAGLLKLWLRKLPAPALTFELYGEWTSELNVPTLATSDDVLAQNLRKVAAKLPSGHFEVCVLLFANLHAVDGSGGLAKAFTPLLLRPRGETVAGAAESAQRRLKVVTTLIRLAPKVFPAAPPLPEPQSHAALAAVEAAAAAGDRTQLDLTLRPQVRAMLRRAIPRRAIL